MDNNYSKKGFDRNNIRSAKKPVKKNTTITQPEDNDFTNVEEEVGFKYQITNQIGAGSYGNVYEAIERETDRKVAIKSIHSIFDDLVD